MTRFLLTFFTLICLIAFSALAETRRSPFEFGAKPFHKKNGDSAYNENEKLLKKFYARVFNVKSTSEFVNAFSDIPEVHRYLLQTVSDRKLKNLPFPKLDYFEKHETLVVTQGKDSLLVNLVSIRPLSFSINGRILMIAPNESFESIEKKTSELFRSSKTSILFFKTLESFALPKAHAQFFGSSGSMNFSPSMMFVLFGSNAFSAWANNKIVEVNHSKAMDKAEERRYKKETEQSDKLLTEIQGSLSDRELTSLNCHEELLKEIHLVDGTAAYQYSFINNKINSIKRTSKDGKVCEFKVLSPRVISSGCQNDVLVDESAIPLQDQFKNILSCCKNETCRPTLYGNIQVIKNLKSGTHPENQNQPRLPPIKWEEQMKKANAK